MKNRTELAAVWPPTAAIAADAKHAPLSPLQAIRRKCLDCSVFQVSEIKLCETLSCSLWPFRSGKHPYTSAKLKNGILDADSNKQNGSEEAATSPSLCQNPNDEE